MKLEFELGSLISHSGPLIITPPACPQCDQYYTVMRPIFTKWFKVCILYTLTKFYFLPWLFIFVMFGILPWFFLLITSFYSATVLFHQDAALLHIKRLRNLNIKNWPIHFGQYSDKRYHLFFFSWFSIHKFY